MYLLKQDNEQMTIAKYTNSHSTMYLLKRMIPIICLSQIPVFTFHHVSIKTNCCVESYPCATDSHSTMYLLKQSASFTNSHSTMYLLKQNESFATKVAEKIHIPPCIY